MKAFAAAAVLAATVVCSAAGAAPAPSISFRVFAAPGLPMDNIVWTGSKFLYVENTANVVYSAPAAGLPLAAFAFMPDEVEETRCVLSPGAHGWPAGVLFCHAPDNRVYEISASGSVKLFATVPVPVPPPADGALAFDTVGPFGYRLVAATGRSGAPTPRGGAVFTIGPSGDVKGVGTYDEPGGADEVAIAPAGWGTAAGEALLTVDAGSSGGSLVAMDARGRTRVLARFPDGPNPIAIIPKHMRTSGTPAPGLYVTDDETKNVFFAPASQLARFGGDVVVGSEIQARWWIVEPRGKGYALVALRSNQHGTFGLEGCTLIG